ncbi:MAG: DUF4384 domain-containing protein, partial [Myxococcales bacterium]|nr:DUF4384 domain-containing protein [Myxococcales bacterium]
MRTRALILSDADPEAEAIIERQAFRLRVRDSDDRVIAPGATMRTGERFYVEIAPVRPVYVYMMYRGPDGRSLPLYPGEHRPPVRLEAGTWTRVPQRQYIELDEQVGEEQLYVFVSERSFSDLPAADSTQQAVAAAQAGREL